MPKILLVDLNNFARYPTLAIGYLVTPLRAAGYEVDVLSPLAIGAPATERERAENWREHLKRQINFATHPVVQPLHEPIRKLYEKWQSEPHVITLKAVQERITQAKPDIILLSAYLNHYGSVQAVAGLALRHKIPVLLGGPAFSQPETIREWLSITGVTAIFAGEADWVIADMVDTAIRRKDLNVWPGIFTHDNGEYAAVAPPLQELDRLPIPDFDDFPWHAYPHRIIPVMTGRGCSWDVCTFCSDVITSNGRSFRSRPVQAVLNELQVQSARYRSKDFIFLDLKLNSNLAMWHGLIDHFQHIIPGGRWIATVHVDAHGENGLDLSTLVAAKAAGLTRISFGLETGSQRLAKRMSKGTDIERNRQFVADAYRAGLSVRCSMMLGYPEETVHDLKDTRNFLLDSLDEFDRVRPARFKAIPGTRFHKLYQQRPDRYQGMTHVAWDYRFARASYQYKPATEPAYRHVKQQVLGLIHTINSKPLRDDARQFDGLM